MTGAYKENYYETETKAAGALNLNLLYSYYAVMRSPGFWGYLTLLTHFYLVACHLIH